MYKLIIEDDEGKKTVVPLIRDEISIGRKEGNTIRLTERNVSRSHAKLIRNNGVVYVEDLESYNGTKVNGSKIGGRRAVSQGDRIQIGDYILGIKLDKEDDELPVESKTQEISREEIEEAQAQSEATTATAATPNNSARLVCISRNFAGLEFSLGEKTAVIGRTDDNDIVVNHRSISRHHASIRKDGTRYFIKDLDSANGVRINGQKYTSAELNQGDEVDLGHVRLRFVLPGETFVVTPNIIVDVESPRTYGGAWMLLFLLIATGVGYAAWQMTKEQNPDDGAQSKPAQHQPIVVTTPTVAPKPDPAEALRTQIYEAIKNQEWATALEICDRLSAEAKQPVAEECRRADVEKDGAALFEQATKFATEGRHKAVIETFHQIPEQSLYRAKLREAHSASWREYLAAMFSEIEQQLKARDCDTAKQQLAELETLVADAEGLAPLKQRIDTCKPRVALAKTTTRPAEKTGEASNSTTKTTKTTETKSNRTKPQTSSTSDSSQTDSSDEESDSSDKGEPGGTPPTDIAPLLDQARNAYIAGHHDKAIKLTLEVLRYYPTNREALQVQGASACYLQKINLAKKAYSRLDPTGRNLLRSVCNRNGIEL